MRPPETPTHREGFMPFPNALMTPSNHGRARDVYHDFLSRFKKVESYGKGEFSDVYKVSGVADTMTSSYFESTLGSKSSMTPCVEKVWIVKRSKTPYTGLKNRTRRLQEVSILQSLGRHDHIVQFVDSWEADYHLCIQTEFCEEGSLHDFLERNGNRGRLDDFRIWKILIETCLVSMSDFVNNKR